MNAWTWYIENETWFWYASVHIHIIKQGFQTASYLEAEQQVVKLEQVVKVQLESDWIHFYRTNKQSTTLSDRLHITKAYHFVFTDVRLWCGLNWFSEIIRDSMHSHSLQWTESSGGEDSWECDSVDREGPFTPVNGKVPSFCLPSFLPFFLLPFLDCHHLSGPEVDRTSWTVWASWPFGFLESHGQHFILL